MIVYLAGGITGLTYEEASGWRHLAEVELKKIGIETLDPFRFDAYDETKPLKTSIVPGFEPVKSVPRRNLHDIDRSHAILVYLDNAKQVSFGTVAEIAWGYYKRIPVISVLGKVHDSAYLREITTYEAATLEQAIYMLGLIKGDTSD